MKIQNTKSKLFIIQLLNFMRISYMAGKAKHVEKRSARSRPVKQVLFTVQNNQLYKYHVIFVLGSCVTYTLFSAVG